MTLAKATKDPNAILPFSIDWAEWISDIAGESVASASWSVDSPPDAALVIGATSVAGAVATAVISGGTLGRSYNLRCRITTAPSGYIDDRTISVRVESR